MLSGSMIAAYGFRATCMHAFIHHAFMSVFPPTHPCMDCLIDTPLILCRCGAVGGGARRDGAVFAQRCAAAGQALVGRSHLCAVQRQDAGRLLWILNARKMNVIHPDSMRVSAICPCASTNSTTWKHQVDGFLDLMELTLLSSECFDIRLPFVFLSRQHFPRHVTCLLLSLSSNFPQCTVSFSHISFLCRSNVQVSFSCLSLSDQMKS